MLPEGLFSFQIFAISATERYSPQILKDYFFNYPRKHDAKTKLNCLEIISSKLAHKLVFLQEEAIAIAAQALNWERTRQDSSLFIIVHVSMEEAHQIKTHIKKCKHRKFSNTKWCPVNFPPSFKLQVLLVSQKATSKSIQCWTVSTLFYQCEASASLPDGSTTSLQVKCSASDPWRISPTI